MVFATVKETKSNGGYSAFIGHRGDGDCEISSRHMKNPATAHSSCDQGAAPGGCEAAFVVRRSANAGAATRERRAPVSAVRIRTTSVQVGDEDLSVTDLAGLSRLDDRVDRRLQLAVVDDDFDLHLGHEVDRVFGATIDFGVTLLAAEAANFGDRHAGDAGRGKRVLDVLQLVMTHDGFNFLHNLQLQNCIGSLYACWTVVARFAVASRESGVRSLAPHPGSRNSQANELASISRRQGASTKPW